MWPRRTLRSGALLLALAGGLVLGGPANAAGTGSIDHAETKDGTLRVLYSIPDLPADVQPDLSSVKMSVNGKAVDAHAELAASAGAKTQVRRTAVLAFDTSKSMNGEKFTQAKAAAKAFLAAAPKDLYVGIVTFAGTVDVAQTPTLDRQAVSAVVDKLSLSLGTHLYDGVVAAADAAGTEGQRSLLVLSDGADTTKTPLQKAVDTISRSKARVDVVVVGQGASANPPLQAMASAGKGSVIAAQDPTALTRLFNDEAQALAHQVLVTAALPKDAATEGSVAISVDAGGQTYTDTAFVSFGHAAAPKTAAVTGPLPVAPPPSWMTPDVLWAGLGAMGLGLLVVLLGAFGVLGKRKKDGLEDTIAAYTRAGSGRSARRGTTGPQAPGSFKESAVGIAEKALEGNSAFESRLAGKLEAADISLKPAEWLLIHSGIAIASALFGFLLSSGGLALTLFLLFGGAVLPWGYLGVRKSRRLKAFNSQLPETLQLIAGSLSAGLSLAQSMDTVVREGSDPMAAEFRRALVEARLGVQVEDSLESIAKRMESADFEWVVMAIRIQREVGGNLAELLLKVAGTMRERDYLRRQVKTLSAEGKLSGWILGALPPGMFAYMMMSNPAYVRPLYTTFLGWMMLGGAALLMGVGAFWMSRVVKVEV